MPTLFARRYVRRIEAVGAIEKVLGVLILLLTAGIVVAFVLHIATERESPFAVEVGAYALPTERITTAAGSAAPAAASAFPDPQVAGWRVPARVERFAADQLYTKINGRAEAFLQFQVAGLTFGAYEHRDDPDRIVEVYWYDMGAPANALAVYRSEEPLGAEPVALGTAAYKIDGGVFLCAGSSYIQLLSSRPTKEDDGVVLRIAERLAAQIAMRTSPGESP